MYLKKLEWGKVEERWEWYVIIYYTRVMVYWLTAQCLTRVARTLVVNRGDHRKDPIQHPHHATHLWLIFLRTHDVCSTTVLCSFPSARGKIPRITQFVLGMYSRYCQQISSLQVETACVLYTLFPRKELSMRILLRT